MVPLAVAAWFACCILSVYLGMRFICWLKRQYTAHESTIVRVILMFEEICDGCKKSCHDHKKLILRACFWGGVIAAATTATYFLVR